MTSPMFDDIQIVSTPEELAASLDTPSTVAERAPLICDHESCDVQTYDGNESRLHSLNHGPRELLCMVCNRDYPVWFAPNEVWNPVMRRADGSDEYPFICTGCFAGIAAKRGERRAFVLSLEERKP